MHWLQEPNQSNVDNLNNVRHEDSRHFRNNKKEYLKAKTHEIEIFSKIKNIRDLYRGISYFKKGYEPRPNITKDEKGDLVIDCHSILGRWRNRFSQLLNVLGANEVRQTAEPRVPEPNAFEVETVIEKLKGHKSPGIDQTQAELVKAWGRTVRPEVHKLFNSIWNKEKLPEEWKESVIVPICKKGDNTYCSNYRGISLFPTVYKILSSILLSSLAPYAEEIIGDHQCGF